MPLRASSWMVWLCAVLMAAGGWGQEQEKPAKKKKPRAPATRLMPAAGADTSKAKSGRKMAVEEKDEDRLRLPEVLIYGRDTTRRIAGKKITVSPDQPELVTPPAIYEPLQAEDIEKGQRQERQQETLQKSSRIELLAFGGQFQQFGGAASFWQKTSRWTYGADISYSELFGQFQNSEKTVLFAGLQLGFNPGAAAAWHLTGRFQSETYGLYGSARPLDSRERSKADVTVKGDIKLTRDTRMIVRAGLQRDRLGDFDSLKTQKQQSTENMALRLVAELQKTFSSADVGLRLDMTSDYRDLPTGRTLQTGLQVWQATISFMPRPWVSLHLSPGFTLSRSDTVEQGRFSPRLRMMLSPHPKFFATFQFRQGLDYVPFREFLTANAYLNLNALPQPRELRWFAAAGAEWRMSKHLVLAFRYQRQRVNGFQYAQRDSAGTFELRQADVRLAGLSINLRYETNKNLKWTVGLNMLEDAIYTDGRLLTLLDLPYRPETEIPVEVVYTPTASWTLQANLLWMGRRKVNLATQREISGFAEMGAQVSYRFGSHVEAFLQIKNILNETYVLWEGYRELGFHLMGGLQARW